MLFSVDGAHAAPRVAILATSPLGDETQLFFVTPNAPLPAPAARFRHRPGASVQAMVLEGTQTVFAVADRTLHRDASYASALVRLTPGEEPEWLCDGVVMASRPLVDGGRVLVARGRAGADRGHEYRIDDLTIDAIDLATRKAHTLTRYTGYLLYLVGIDRGEVIVYRVGPEGADVVALGATGGLRVVLPTLEPYARDFHLDANGIVEFQNRHGREWVGYWVDLRNPARTATPETVAPLARASATDTRWSAELVPRPGDFPVARLTDRQRGHTQSLPAPPGLRITIAGFVP